MKELGIDLETFSATSIEYGTPAYVEDPEFEILLFAYKIDDEPTVCVDLKNLERIPKHVVNAIFDPNVKKTAFNAAFEMACIGEHFSRLRGERIELDASQWYCTMILSLKCGLPGKLQKVGEVLELDVQKMKEGKALVRYWCVPIPYPKNPKPGYVHKHRRLPEDNPEKWELFKYYNTTDVDSERAIIHRLSWFNDSIFERKLWATDQKINRRGVCMDREFIVSATELFYQVEAELIEQLKTLTGIDNPNSDAQIKEWLGEELDTEVKSLNKKVMPDLLRSIDSELALKVLSLRTDLNTTSVKKYFTMLDVMNADDYIRYLLQYYAANRTGRWGGRAVQPQNLTKNKIDGTLLDLARDLIRRRRKKTIELIFGNVLNLLSQCIRTSFIASPGNDLKVADYSSIEARVISWLAGSRWRLDVFHKHGLIYEATAALMYKVHIGTIIVLDDDGNPVLNHEGNVIKNINYHLRANGKVAELALGYQGGVNALITSGALELGLKESELQPIVDLYREANPDIVQMWYDFQEAAIAAIESPGERKYVQQDICFYVEHDCMFMRLPSGRKLCYWKPRLKDKIIKTRKGKDMKVKDITYMGLDQKTKQWTTQHTYGGKLVENATQAIARDCLAEALVISERRGIPIVLHVHDEIVADSKKGNNDLELLSEIMSYPIEWAPGLPLKASCFTTPYYIKD